MSGIGSDFAALADALVDDIETRLAIHPDTYSRTGLHAHILRTIDAAVRLERAACAKACRDVAISSGPASPKRDGASDCERAILARNA